MANVLIVVGSPRKGGNSWMMAEACAQGARQAGNEVRILDAGHAKINGCVACECCFKNGGMCTQKDDMQEMYNDLEWANVLVYAFPMYFYSYPAQIKAFMDRQFCAAAGRKVIPHRVALLMPYEDKNVERAEGIKKSFEIVTEYCKQEVVGMVLASGNYAKGAIEGKPALDECRQLGASIA